MADEGILDYSPETADILRQYYSFNETDLEMFRRKGTMTESEVNNITRINESHPPASFDPVGNFASGIIPGAVGDVAGLAASKIPVVGPVTGPLVSGLASTYALGGNTSDFFSSMTEPENLLKMGAAMGAGAGIMATGPVSIPTLGAAYLASSLAPSVVEAAGDFIKPVFGYKDDDNTSWADYGNEAFNNLGGGFFQTGKQIATRGIRDKLIGYSERFDGPNEAEVRRANLESLKSTLRYSNPQAYETAMGRSIQDSVGIAAGSGATAQALKSDKTLSKLPSVLNKWFTDKLNGLFKASNGDSNAVWDQIPSALEDLTGENSPILARRDSIIAQYENLPAENLSESNLYEYIGSVNRSKLKIPEKRVDPETGENYTEIVKKPAPIDERTRAMSSSGFGTTPADAAKMYLQDIRKGNYTIGQLLGKLRDIDDRISQSGGYSRSAETRALVKAEDVLTPTQTAVLKAVRKDLSDSIHNSIESINPSDAAEWKQLGGEYHTLLEFKKRFDSVVPTLQVNRTVGGLNEITADIATTEPVSRGGTNFLQRMLGNVGPAGREWRESIKGAKLQAILDEKGRRAKGLMNTLLSYRDDPSAFPDANPAAFQGSRYTGGVAGAIAGFPIGSALGNSIWFGVLGSGLGGALGYEYGPEIGRGLYGMGTSGLSSLPYSNAMIQQGMRSPGATPQAYADVPPGLIGPRGMSSPMGMVHDALDLAQMQAQMDLSPKSDPKAINTIMSAIMPERDFANGLPRSSAQWDPKAIYQFVSSVVPTGDPRAPVAKLMVNKLLSATQQGDEVEKRKVLTDMSRLFPDLFEAGMGIDNVLLHPEDQKKYVSSLKSGLYSGTVDSHLLTEQLQRFANPEDGGMVPYRQPINNTVRSDAMGTPIKIKLTRKPVGYEY